jgi:hypothetical protein
VSTLPLPHDIGLPIKDLVKKVRIRNKKRVVDVVLGIINVMEDLRDAICGDEVTSRRSLHADREDLVCHVTLVVVLALHAQSIFKNDEIRTQSTNIVAVAIVGKSKRSVHG